MVENFYSQNYLNDPENMNQVPFWKYVDQLSEDARSLFLERMDETMENQVVQTFIRIKV